jgi:hypothetical protein
MPQSRFLNGPTSGTTLLGHFTIPFESAVDRPTPAMMAGLTDRLWSFEDLYDAVTR